MGFVQYCAFNMGEDHVLYGGKLAVKVGTDQMCIRDRTNDGALAQGMTHPSYHINKTYEVVVDGHVEEEKLDKLRTGIRPVSYTHLQGRSCENRRNR